MAVLGDPQELTAVFATTMERFSTENPRAPGGADSSVRLPIDDSDEEKAPFKWSVASFFVAPPTSSPERPRTCLTPSTGETNSYDYQHVSYAHFQPGYIPRVAHADGAAVTQCFCQLRSSSVSLAVQNFRARPLGSLHRRPRASHGRMSPHGPPSQHFRSVPPCS